MCVCVYVSMHMSKIKYNCPKIIQQQSYLCVFLTLCWWGQTVPVSYLCLFYSQKFEVDDGLESEAKLQELSGLRGKCPVPHPVQLSAFLQKHVLAELALPEKKGRKLLHVHNRTQK